MSRKLLILGPVSSLGTVAPTLYLKAPKTIILTFPQITGEPIDPDELREAKNFDAADVPVPNRAHDPVLNLHLQDTENNSATKSKTLTVPAAPNVVISCS